VARSPSTLSRQTVASAPFPSAKRACSNLLIPLNDIFGIACSNLFSGSIASLAHVSLPPQSYQSRQRPRTTIIRFKIRQLILNEPPQSRVQLAVVLQLQSRAARLNKHASNAPISFFSSSSSCPFPFPLYLTWLLPFPYLSQRHPYSLPIKPLFL
jgi:hypothetical protein